jgi:hypothetical protein
MGGQIVALLEPQPSQPGQLDSVGQDDDAASEAEAAQPALLVRALWIPHLSTQLALLLELAAAVKVREGMIEVPQRLLRRAFGDLIQPGYSGLLERVEVTMQLDRRGTHTRDAIGFLFAG